MNAKDSEHLVKIYKILHDIEIPLLITDAAIAALIRDTSVSNGYMITWSDPIKDKDGVFTFKNENETFSISGKSMYSVVYFVMLQLFNKDRMLISYLTHTSIMNIMESLKYLTY
jgi:type II secretory pathway component GspD/PulD (secretin)